MAASKQRWFRKVAAALMVLGTLLCLGIGVPIWRILQQQALNQQLIGAIRRNDTPVAIELLQQGADANSNDEPESRARAWETLHARIVGKRLTSPKTLTALLLATRPHAAFDDLLDAPDHPVHTLDNLAMIRALLEHRADPNAHDPQSFTALLYAIRWQKYAAADLLLTHGADPDEGDKNHETPLMIAIYLDDLKAMHLLLDHGAHLDRAEDINGQTALMLAVTLRRSACIALLMARHPDLTLRDHNGKTALDYAREEGYSANLIPLKPTQGSP